MNIAFDISRMKPGCAIVQATFGCDGMIADNFDTKHWLLAPTDEMRVYPVTKDQLRELVQKVEEHHK